MSFIQETLHSSLTKDLSFTILQQLQKSNSALQDLLYRVSATRDCPKLKAIQSKIDRVQNFKFVKQSVLQILQNDQNAVVYEWISNSLYGSNLFLYELIKKEEITLSIKKNIYQIVKQTFLNDQTLEDHLEQNQLAKICLQKLNQLKQQANVQKIPSRLFVKEVDQKCQKLDLIIINFNKKVQKFNFLIWNLMKKIFQFQQRISKSFVSFISSSDKHQNKRQESSKNQSNQNSRLLQIESKNSQNHQNLVQQQNLMHIQNSNQNQPQQNYRNRHYSSEKQKSTPRKKLNTQEQFLHRNVGKHGSVISPSDNLFEYNHQPSRSNLLRNYDKPIIPTRDSKRLTLTNNFFQTDLDAPKAYDSDLLNNFNKTLQDLSYHRQRGSYLMQNPAPISIISQNPNKPNTRSSISYNNSRSGSSSYIYPMR